MLRSDTAGARVRGLGLASRLRLDWGTVWDHAWSLVLVLRQIKVRIQPRVSLLSVVKARKSMSRIRLGQDQI